MLIEKIRAATEESHQRLEARLFPYLHAIDSPEKYARLLQSFYGYIYPVQEKISAHIDSHIVPDMEARRNASLIRADLHVLGYDINGENASQIPLISTHAAAMGALYVLEGSTLGGKIIAKTIGDKLGGNTPLGFFRGYGPETGPMWKKFMQYLEHPHHENAQEIISQSAAQTFTLFGTWFEKTLPV